ncbi:MarR family winged helix-turn-helix transcriptional regulator [Mycolicibacter arupensis]|uniref:MarR family transcriptional regulator n=1 Tax=Mycolicibacter arupensis TaxID=342002 RepID=A0A5C7YCY9_9MYCO|nr:MarR family transcriptional regulator [Mycolicibacter arupensis]TXI59522.1 MAG: MarR family transcriptional regulator [Mycolicibacter arupensis]
MTDTPESDLSRNLLWLLKQAFHYSLTTVNEAIGHHGVSSAQIALLRQLADEPGLSSAQLSRRLLITPQGVQLAVRALERRGLVERRRDPRHGRILRAHLTEEGRAVTSVVVTDALDAHDQVFGVLTSDEQDSLRDLLARFVDHHNGRPQP